MRSNQAAKWLASYAVIFMAFIYIPILLLPVFSFSDSQYIAFPIKEFTLEWYRRMASATALHGALMNSTKVAISVAILATILGMTAALAFTRYKLRGHPLLSGIVVLPLVIPSLILAIAQLVVLRKFLNIDLSLMTVVAGHLLLCTPFSVLVLIARLEGFDKSLEEASIDLGAGRLSTFYRVTLPLAFPGVVSSLLICFTISFDEFVMAFFLSSSKPTLPLYIWSQLRFPQKLPEVLALGSCIIVFSFAVIGFAEWYRRVGGASGVVPRGAGDGR